MARKIGTIVIVAALTAGLVWLFWKPAPPPEKVVETPKAATPAPVAPKLNTQQVAAPKAAPAIPKAETTKPEPAAPSGDPQAELNTSLTDIVSLLQSGDLLTAFDRYLPPDFLAQMPPQQKAMMEQQLPAAMADPQAQQAIQMMVIVVQGMQTQTPTFNDAGDTATYQISDPSGRATNTKPFSMRKIDGKWYVDPQALNGL